MKNGFKMKDVVTIALLTALYMVFYMITMAIITPLGPFGHAISPGMCAVLTGSVLIFISRKVGKMWGRIYSLGSKFAGYGCSCRPYSFKRRKNR